MQMKRRSEIKLDSYAFSSPQLIIQNNICSNSNMQQSISDSLERGCGKEVTKPHSHIIFKLIGYASKPISTT
jgi:hypothetical protein